MRFLLIIAIPVVVAWCSEAHANDVEPRLYSNVPTGLNFFSIGYAHSSGEVTFDTSVPLADVEGEVDSMVLSYSRGLNIAGKSALLTFVIPYADIDLEGLYLGEPVSGRRPGFGDPRIRLSVNFYGAPATTRKEYATYQQKTIVGGSISVGMPFGRYVEDKVLNVGSNRWNVVGQLGVSRQINRWIIESAIGVSWNSHNDELLGTRKLEQDPIGLFRATLIYNFSPGLWVGAGAIYAGGGDTTLDGVRRDDRQKNWRAGLAVSIPLAPGRAVSLRVTEGITSRIGAVFSTYSAAYTYAF